MEAILDGIVMLVGLAIAAILISLICYLVVVAVIIAIEWIIDRIEGRSWYE